MAVNVYGVSDQNIVGPISDGKVWPRHLFGRDQTGAVAAAKYYFRINNSGVILYLWAALTEVLSTGGDSVTIDLKKSTGGGAFASILSAPLVLNASSTLYIPQQATIAAPSVAAGDLLQLTVAVSGTSSHGLEVDCAVPQTP